LFGDHDLSVTTALHCETVTGRSMAEPLTARDRATHGDMVELRLDGVADVDVAGARQMARSRFVACDRCDARRVGAHRHHESRGEHDALSGRGLFRATASTSEDFEAAVEAALS
jgi:hypothetical protein